MLTNLKSFFTTLFFAWACMAGAETVPQYDLRDFDFSLVDPADFFFVVVSDTHVTPVSEPCELSEMVQPYVKYETWGLFNARFNNNKFALVIEQVNAMDPAFMVHLGDIVTSWPTTETYNDEARNANELMEALEVPYYLTPGNHDIGNKWQKDAVKVSGNFGKLNVSEENEKRYKGHFGDVFFSWDYQGRHFIVLNMEILNSPLEDNRLQMEWLRRDLEENKDAEQIYMFGHRTLYWNTPHDIGTNHYEVINEPARSEILDLVERYGVEAFYTGHTHHTIRNRYGSTQLITAPSTAFYRNTYMFYPALSGGNHDPAKCGYFIVRVYDDKAVTNLVRNIDVLPDVEPAQEGQPVRAKRVVTKQSVESEGALVMLDVPVPTSTRVQAGP